ncbi:FliG C-terminal domain-containing protein [Zhongshania guokunii]|uniref:Flagellar motor switch protein FliG n=1 Tax=Zhongshania guokunii TaxID=641783 RepID=A0ABV3U7Z5_9GAMM
MAGAVATELSNTEQAAALLMSLDKRDAAAVMRALPPRDLHRLAAVMTTMSAPDSREFTGILQRFHSDVKRFSGVKASASDAVQGLLEEALGEERAKLLSDRLAFHGQAKHIAKLKWLDAATIAGIIRREHPQIQVVVIACLESRLASEVLLEFDEAKRVDILGRLSCLKSLTPAALEELDWLLEQYFNNLGRPVGRALPGDTMAANLLNEMDVGAESTLLNGLRASQPESAARVEELMFGFAQIINMADRDVAVLVHQLAPEVLAPALLGVESRLRARLLASLPADKKTALAAIEPNFTQVERESARAEIVSVAKQMAAVGEIILDARKIDVF